MEAFWSTLSTIVAMCVVIGRADAGVLGDALQRHSDRDVAALRALRPDVAAGCTLGAVYARRNDLPRAALYLTNCDDAALPDDVAAEVARIDRDVKKRLRASDLAVLEVVTRPGGMIGEIDALPGETFTTPATLYVTPGRYTVQVDGHVATVTANKRSRGVVILDAETTTVVAPTDTTIDFGKDIGAETQQSGPPPDIKHANLIRDKYLKGIEASGVAADNPNAIDDPLATTETLRVARNYWLGIRIGGGMFDDSAAPARAGMSVAAAGRATLGGRNFLAGRLDWSRRGGEAVDRVDVIGASAGIGRTVIDRHSLGVALLAQLRGDFRIADSRALAPIDRLGASVALGVELALPRTPFTAGIRFEQGVTRFVSDGRDRALLFELGLDWR